MITTAIPNPLQRFEEIIKRLNILGHKESNFTQVELLFFESFNLARDYRGNDVESNSMLLELKHLQQDQYEKTKASTRKATQREQHIRRFITRFKKILSGKGQMR